MPTPTEQLLSRTVYLTDGTTLNWDFSFSGGYLLPAHVKAFTEVPATGQRTDVVVTAPMLVGPYQLRISPAVASGLYLTIYRDTPKNLPLVDFTDESGFSEVALDTNAKQAVFIAAETQDVVNTSSSYDAEQAAIGALAAASAAVAAANAALASANAAAASAGIITIPLPIASGGTGATDATGARSALSSAKSGANSDITSLSAMSTALSKTQGGTGNTTGSGDTGDIKFWPTAVAPAGWLKCDGSLASTTAYAALFALIGYTFGGAGATFALPNATNRMLVAAGGLYAVGATGGSKDASIVNHTHTVTTGIESASHTHTLNDPGHVHTIAGSMQNYGVLSGGSSVITQISSSNTNNNTTGITLNGQTANHTHSGTTANPAGGVAVTDVNMTPYLGVTVVIKT